MLVVKPPLFLISTNILCWWCSEQMPVVGIVSRDVTEIEDGEEFPHTTEPDDFVTLSYIESLPDALIAEIHTHVPTYHLSTSSTLKQQYLANYCPRCNSLQGDHYLYSEPDQAFFPTSESGLQDIRVETMLFADPFETVASVGSSTPIRMLLRRHLGLPEPVPKKRRSATARRPRKS